MRTQTEETRSFSQFARGGPIGGVCYAVSGNKSYSLDIEPEDDTICLVLGNVYADMQLDDSQMKPQDFIAASCSFHARRERVRVDGHRIDSAFIAFSYGRHFLQMTCEGSIASLRRGGHALNLQSDKIFHLARYAKSMINRRYDTDSLELQCLASMVLLETTAILKPRHRRGGQHGTSDFRRTRDFIDANLDQKLTVDAVASALGLPVRVIFHGVKIKTGLSFYQYVLQRRLFRACDMLAHTQLSISEIALDCGFSSQQHLTSMLSSRYGCTPGWIRANKSWIK